MRSFLSIIAAPTLCLGLMGGILIENGRHARPADAEPFHAAAKAAIDAWPKTVGVWTSHDSPLPTAAVRLLKPNAHFYRTFAIPKIAVPRSANDWEQVGLLVVQCKDPSDMSGHYPPNCYPHSGWKAGAEVARTWNIPGLGVPIRGMEYSFSGGTFGKPENQTIYNFFMLPGRGIVPDMNTLRDATGDYQRRHFGAAQIQVIFFDADLDTAARDEIFAELMKSGMDALKTLTPSGV